MLLSAQKRPVTAGFLFFLLFLSNAYAEEKPFHVRASILGGYDNNTGLNADRKADGFSQENLAFDYQRLLNKKAQMRLSYSALNINYFEATDFDILAHEAAAGLNFLLAPETVLETNYVFQYLGFPYNNSIDSYSNEGRVGLRQRFGKQWILKGGVSVSDRDYTSKKTRKADGSSSLDDERGDGRSAIDGLVRFKWSPKVTLNLGGLYYWSDSNDLFHDYYDYDAYKIIPSVSWRINEKLSSWIKLVYEKRRYDSRPLSNSSNIFQKDDVYTASAGLFYKLNPDLSLGSVYTYRQKNSNEPSQKYSSASGTLGLYYSY